MRDTLKIKSDEEQRIKQYGPVPSNPFRELRLSHSFSLEILAKASYIDQSALLRTEQGLYANPLPSLVDYWVSRGVTYPDLLNEYEDFQLNQRLRHLYYFGTNLITDPYSDRHPFRQLRDRRPSLVTDRPLPVGPVETSRSLCLPLDSLQFFEKNWKTQQSVPKIIKYVLNVIGHDDEEIQDFEDTYKKWRELQIKSKVRFS